jgi:rubrerythrin
MTGSSLTASAIISLSEELEDTASRFYEQLAERWPEHQKAFLAFAKESQKNKLQVVRTYQETISDAYEASYSFQGMDPTAFQVDATLAEGAGLAQALEKAQQMEDTAVAFYQEVAERSESLLATIPMTFKRVARRRAKRQRELEALLPR